MERIRLQLADGEGDEFIHASVATVSSQHFAKITEMGEKSARVPEWCERSTLLTFLHLMYVGVVENCPPSTVLQMGRLAKYFRSSAVENSCVEAVLANVTAEFPLLQLFNWATQIERTCLLDQLLSKVDNVRQLK